MKGVSLLETIVVVAIIAVLSIMGINNINNFKNDARMDNAANELISDIRLARSKSMNGELLGNESEDNFDPNGLPEYGLAVSGNSYQIIRRCLKDDGSDCNSEPAIESVNLGTEFTISPGGIFYFERITGAAEEKIFTITDNNGNYGRQISISADFLITVTKIN
jgi:Tfp pilus assembly protein FimT